MQSFKILFIILKKQSTYIRFLQNGFTDTPVNDDWAFIVDNSVLTFTKDSKDEEASVSIENKSNLSCYSKIKFDINDLGSVRRIYQGIFYGLFLLKIENGYGQATRLSRFPKKLFQN